MMFFFSARKLMLGGQNPDSTVHYQSTQRPPGDPPTQNSVEIKQPLLLWWWEKEQEIETLVLSRTKMLLPQVSVLHLVCTLTCECMCVCVLMLINAWKVPPTARPWILWPRKAHTALFTPMDADINTHKASGPSVVCWQCLCLCTWMSFIEWGSIKAGPRKSRALQCLSPLILQHTPPEEHTHRAWYASRQHIYCSSNLFVSVILSFSYTPNKGLKLLLIHRLLSGALRQTVSSLCWQTLPFNHLGVNLQSNSVYSSLWLWERLRHHTVNRISIMILASCK